MICRSLLPWSYLLQLYQCPLLVSHLLTLCDPYSLVLVSAFESANTSSSLFRLVLIGKDLLLGPWAEGLSLRLQLSRVGARFYDWCWYNCPLQGSQIVGLLPGMRTGVVPDKSLGWLPKDHRAGSWVGRIGPGS